MYTTMTIGAIQGIKSEFVKNFVPNEALAKPMQEFISAQTTFANAVLDTTKEVVKQSYNEYLKLFSKGDK